MGNNLENELMELNIVIEILEKEMQACKMCKEADEKNFSKSFLNYYGILCEFKNGYIVCNVGNVNNREEHYRNILKKYWHLLYKQGFDNENEFRQITQNYAVY